MSNFKLTYSFFYQHYCLLSCSLANNRVINIQFWFGVFSFQLAMIKVATYMGRSFLRFDFSVNTQHKSLMLLSFQDKYHHLLHIFFHYPFQNIILNSLVKVCKASLSKSGGSTFFSFSLTFTKKTILLRAGTLLFSMIMFFLGLVSDSSSLNEISSVSAIKSSLSDETGGSQNSLKVFCIIALSSPSIRGFVNKGTNDAKTLLSRICLSETKIPLRIRSD
ncbi:hypothetical protein AGLY_006375 [Aphis glycines]|uniref:Uncharacterized protein n=1 Tax=Aphis glycines TaxID=307491 RepID=A0A6G0TRF5_APHGL|nr:hypothetical protein AGLY_006375 [Aphis glycines]